MPKRSWSDHDRPAIVLEMADGEVETLILGRAALKTMDDDEGGLEYA